MPEGFAYRDNAVSAGDAGALVAIFEALPFKPFEFHGYLGNRRTVSFGWNYDYAGRALRKGEPLPDFLLPLRALAGEFAGMPPALLEQSTIIEYAPGAGIGWHRDKPDFRDVLAFSFVAPCNLRFRRKRGAGTWDRAAITAHPRSLYLLRGDARTDWYHSTAPNGASLLRHVPQSDGPGVLRLSGVEADERKPRPPAVLSRISGRFPFAVSMDGQLPDGKTLQN